MNEHSTNDSQNTSVCPNDNTADDLVIIGKNADKITPENKKRLFDAAREMFKEDFGE